MILCSLDLKNELQNSRCGFQNDVVSNVIEKPTVRIKRRSNEISVESIILKMGGTINDDDAMSSSHYRIPTKSIYLPTMGKGNWTNIKSIIEDKEPPRERWKDGSTLYKYSQCVISNAIDRMESTPFNDLNFNVSIVCVFRFNRLFIAPTFASRWNGPIVFVIHLKLEQMHEFHSFITRDVNSILCTSRIQLFIYVSERGSFFYDNYPINILRNIGIRHTLTSHFLVLDSDMWMSDNSYERVLEMPKVVHEAQKTAIIVPSFFHTGWKIENGTIEEQVESVKHDIPFTMDQLIQCVNVGKCGLLKKGLFTHLYIPHEWIIDKRKGVFQQYYELKCWLNPYQEPYIILRRNDSLCRFHEGFINYGFNKISLVETLRYHGYRFILGGNFFSFDLPHLPSQYQQDHARSTKSRSYTTYIYYLYELKTKTKNMEITMKLC